MSLIADGIVNRVLVPLAVPLFLFDSDLKVFANFKSFLVVMIAPIKTHHILSCSFQRVISDAGSLLAAFFVGAISTIIGTLGSFALVPLTSLENEGWKVASALAARHIGGAINL